MIHLQSGVDNWLEAVQRLPAQTLVKAVDQVAALEEAKQTNPLVSTLLRHWYDGNQHFGGTYEENKQRARTFFDTFIDGTFMGYAGSVDYVETFNEYLATGMPQHELDKRILWAEAAADVWRSEYRTRPGLSHIRLCLANTPVGNDIPLEFAEIATDYDCILSYHAYSHWINSVRDSGDWLYFSGRWDTMDQMYRDNGYNVTWAFTECGPFEAVETGWRHPSCMDGNVELYIDSMRTWVNEMKQTDAYQTGRIAGFTLFTTGGGERWRHFETKQPELNALADMVAEEWHPGTAPPERAVGTDVSFWQGDIDFNVMEQRGAAFTFIRSTMGTQYKDTNLDENWAGASETGILKGQYHVFINDLDPEEQAAYAVEKSFNGELPIVGDFELTDGADVLASHLSGWSVDGEEIALFPASLAKEIPTDLADRVHRWLLEVERLSGVRPIIYSSQGWWNSFIGDVPWAQDYDLWIAQYNNFDEPTLPRGFDTWVFWQWTSDGNGPEWGASSPRIDLNRFNGTEAELMEKYSPIGDNLLRNGSFEDGWYHPDNIPELQIPNEWAFEHKDESFPNPHDSSPGAVFRRPEVRVMPKNQLPPDEQDLFVLDGEYTLKPFGDHKSWYGSFNQGVALSTGGYSLFIPVYADLVKGYDANGNKIWADDPEGRDGLMRMLLGTDEIMPWTSLDPGRWNWIEVLFDNDYDAALLSIEFMCPFPLVNSGLFLDDWQLTKTDTTLEEHMWAASLLAQCISLNPDAALQAAIYADGFVPVGSEFWTDYDDESYAGQPAEHLGTGERRVYMAKVPDWNNVWWIS